MNDTPEHIAGKQREIIMAKTPGERAAMGTDMIDSVYYMIRDQIKQENPTLNEKEVTAKLFLRYYKNDFSDEIKKRITNLIKGERANL